MKTDRMIFNKYNKRFNKNYMIKSKDLIEQKWYSEEEMDEMKQYVKNIQFNWFKETRNQNIEIKNLKQEVNNLLNKIKLLRE